MEAKLLDFNSVSGEFTAYASVFNNVDLTGDIVERGAFARTIRDAQARKAANRSRFLWPLLHMHDNTRAIGGVETAVEDSYGLKITGVVDVNVPAGQAVYSGLKSGYSDRFSIGYDTIKAVRDAKGVRHLTEVKLWEVSVVTTGFAANELAAADPLSVKSRDPYRDALEQMAAIMTGGRRAGRATRPSVGAGDAPEPVEPQPGDYVSDAKYRAAMDEWATDVAAVRYARSLPTQAEVNRAEWERRVQAFDAQRLASGMATMRERIAAAPDDRALRERVTRAGVALRERLENPTGD